MKKRIAAITFSIVVGSWAAGAESSISADFVFENVNVLPMDDETVLRDKAVVVEDGWISAIVDQEDAGSIQAAERVSGNGRYLMPGLADMHVHVRWDPRKMFNLFLAHGVTTVANMRLADGGGSIDHLQLRAAIASGEMVGPRYLVSGPHLEGGLPGSVDEVDRILDDHVKQGFDFVKIHGDLEGDVFDAVIAGARARGLRVVGHAQHKMPLGKTLEMDSLEHMEEFLYVSREAGLAEGADQDFLEAYRANVRRLRDPAYREAVANDVAASGVFVDPTLIVYKMIGRWTSDEDLVAMRNDPEMRYLPDGVREKWLSLESNPYQEEGFPLATSEVEQNLEVLYMLTKELHDKGVPLLLGTDSFGTLVPGRSVHRELALLVEAGLSPYEALKAGTSTVADYLEESDVAGFVRPGYRADFILLDENPLVDIKKSRTVSGVFTGGRWHPKADIEALLDSARQP